MRCTDYFDGLKVQIKIFEQSEVQYSDTIRFFRDFMNIIKSYITVEYTLCDTIQISLLGVLIFLPEGRKGGRENVKDTLLLSLIVRLRTVACPVIY